MDPELESLTVLISNKTGLSFREQDIDQFRTVITARVRANALTSLDQYYSLLEASSLTSEQEWRKLISLLTVGESYFFRDHDQFKLIRERILPELIAARKDTRSLSIWSGGCSTGEEPYSLAMVIGELLPDRHDWRISIVGTDINEEAIGKAKRGIYGSWSFRRVSAEVRHRYFRSSSQGWEIDGRIRRMVDFRIENLLEIDGAPIWGHGNVDLILCRNVFIYFNRQAVAEVIDSFVNVLTAGGYLMTGHGELMGLGLEFNRLRARIFPESVIYRKIRDEKLVSREAALEIKPEPKPFPLRSVGPLLGTPTVVIRRPSNSGDTIPNSFPVRRIKQELGMVSPEFRDPHATLGRLLRRGDYRAVIDLGERMIKEDASNLKTYYYTARAYANLGMYEKATELCSNMLQVKVDTPVAYLLLAQIAEAREEYEEAKRLLKKVIYLDSACVAAYVELSSLYSREDDDKRATTMRRSAAELLKSQPQETVVEPYDSMTAGDLLGYLLPNR